MSSTDQNKTTARRIAEELWTKKNAHVIDEIFSPNYTMSTPDGEQKGPDGYRKFFNTYTTAFPDLTMHVNDIIAEGDKVTLSFTVRGTHKGRLKDLDPTGKKVDVSGLVLATFSNGKVTREVTVWDTLRMAEQLGMVPAHQHSR